MPIYEYKCQECGNQFEFLVLPPAKDASACPSCKSDKLERMISRFAVSSKGIRDANWKAARKNGMKVGLEKQNEDVKYKHKVMKETDQSGK
jgi:putative FmdB family regulatory protein